MNLSKLFKHELSHIYLFHSIATFGINMVNIFVAIFLLTLGYTLTQVLFFLIIRYSTLLLFTFISIYLSKFLGLKRVTMLRLPFLLIFLILLYSMDIFRTPLCILAILDGLQSALHWIPMQILFIRATKNKSMGKQVGNLNFYSRLAGVVSPLIGGLITFFLGFKVLFGIASIIFILSYVPLFWAPDVKPVTSLHYKKIWKLVKSNKSFLFLTSVRSSGAMTERFIWPIFIYLALFSTLSVGIIGTVLGFGMAVVSRMVGHYTDKHNKLKVLKIGVLLLIVIWLVRGLFDLSPVALYVITALAGISFIIMKIPFSAISFNIGKRTSPEDLIAIREIPFWIGRMIIFGLCMIFVTNLKILFLITAGLYSLIFFLHSDNILN